MTPTNFALYQIAVTIEAGSLPTPLTASCVSQL